MGGIVFFVGLLAIALAITDSTLQLGLPIDFVYNPLMWVVYVIVLTLSAVVKFVRQQEAIVVERLGKYNRTLTAGLNFLIPILERAAFQFDLREKVIDVPAQVAITKDNASMTIDGILYYKVIHAKDAAYGAENIDRAVINLAQTSMRSTIGAMELDKTFENRTEINGKVVAVVTEAAATWGVQVTRYEIKDIAMPKSLQESMERQMKAERDKRATILESEGFRQAEINKAEGEKQAAILRATGEKESAILVAQGQAEAIKLVANEIGKQGGEKAVQLEVAKDALGKYGELAKKGTTLILMGESSEPMGWIAKAMGVFKATDQVPTPSAPTPLSVAA